MLFFKKGDIVKLKKKDKNINLDVNQEYIVSKCWINFDKLSVKFEKINGIYKSSKFELCRSGKIKKLLEE